jgi:hypothetical protein
MSSVYSILVTDTIDLLEAHKVVAGFGFEKRHECKEGVLEIYRSLLAVEVRRVFS